MIESNHATYSIETLQVYRISCLTIFAIALFQKEEHILEDITFVFFPDPNLTFWIRDLLRIKGLKRKEKIIERMNSMKKSKLNNKLHNYRK